MHFEQADYIDDLFVADDESSESWKYFEPDQRPASSYFTPSFSFVSDMDGEVVDITNLAASQWTDSMLGISNAWYGHADWDEIDKDIKSIFIAADAKVALIETALHSLHGKFPKQPKKKGARREATAAQKKQYQWQFSKANHDECEPWMQEDVFELIDMRKMKVGNYVTGRWF